MTFLFTATPDDSRSLADAEASFVSSASSDDALSPDPLEGASVDWFDFLDSAVSLLSDDSSSPGLKIFGMSLLLEYSIRIRMIQS